VVPGFIAGMNKMSIFIVLQPADSIRIFRENSDSEARMAAREPNSYLRRIPLSRFIFNAFGAKAISGFVFKHIVGPSELHAARPFVFINIVGPSVKIDSQRAPLWKMSCRNKTFIINGLHFREICRAGVNGLIFHRHRGNKRRSRWVQAIPRV
jgi:hypothetical protein